MCSNPSIQSEVHTGRRNASEQSTYPLETRDKFQRQCPPSQRSSDASPWAHSFVPHTGRQRGSCAHSPVTPLLRTAQDLSLPIKHSDTTSHTRTFWALPNTPLPTLLPPQQQSSLHRNWRSPQPDLYMLIIRLPWCADTMRGPVDKDFLV